MASIEFTVFGADEPVPEAEGAERRGVGATGRGWPASRLVEVWNTLPGVTVVQKFTDRKTAVARICAA